MYNVHNDSMIYLPFNRDKTNQLCTTFLEKSITIKKMRAKSTRACFRSISFFHADSQASMLYDQLFKRVIIAL